MTSFPQDEPEDEQRDQPEPSTEPSDEAADEPPDEVDPPQSHDFRDLTDVWDEPEADAPSSRRSSTSSSSWSSYGAPPFSQSWAKAAGVGVGSIWNANRDIGGVLKGLDWQKNLLTGGAVTALAEAQKRVMGEAVNTLASGALFQMPSIAERVMPSVYAATSLASQQDHIVRTVGAAVRDVPRRNDIWRVGSAIDAFASAGLTSIQRDTFAGLYETIRMPGLEAFVSQGIRTQSLMETIAPLIAQRGAYDLAAGVLTGSAFAEAVKVGNLATKYADIGGFATSHLTSLVTSPAFTDIVRPFPDLSSFVPLSTRVPTQRRTTPAPSTQPQEELPDEATLARELSEAYQDERLLLDFARTMSLDLSDDQVLALVRLRAAGLRLLRTQARRGGHIVAGAAVHWTYTEMPEMYDEIGALVAFLMFFATVTGAKMKRDGK